MGMRIPRRSIRSAIVTCVALALSGGASALADTTGPVDLPTPLRTKDLQKWITDVKPSDPQRVAMERAFDACVDQWTTLRDQTVRPAQGKLDAKSDDAAAEAAWRATVARAFETTRGTERTMFDAMRAAGLSTEQTAIDQKTRAWEVSATPVIDRLATASMDDKAADRAADLKRKLLASQRSAVRDIATLLRATLRVCDPGPEERVSSSASSRHCLHCQAAPLRTPSADCSCRDRSPAPILRPS